MSSTTTCDFVARPTLSARSQVAVLAARASSGPAVPHSVAVLVWSHVVATQVRVSAKVRGTPPVVVGGKQSLLGTLAFGVSPTLLGVVGPVEVRPLWPWRWVDDTRYIDMTPNGRLVLRDLDWAGRGVQLMGGGRFHRMGQGINSMWFVDCGTDLDDVEKRIVLRVQPTPHVSVSSSSSSSSASPTSPAAAAVVTVPLPYTGHSHMIQLLAFNAQNLDEIIMVVQPLGTLDVISLVRIDARVTHSTKSLCAISSTLSNIGEEEHVVWVIHIKSRQSHPESGCSSFIAALRERTAVGDNWQISQVEEGSGAARMIAYSRERLGISWLTTSKFIISHTEACGGPDYEVWDRENPELRPLKEVLLPCHVNPEEERGELWESAGADKLPPQTRMESCCVIQAVNQNQVFVYDILSEFLVLTVEFPHWNSLYLSDTHSS